MGVAILCMVLGTGFVAAWAWMGVLALRDDRRAARAERESAEQFDLRKDEIDAAMARSAARMPKRPHALRASVEAEVAEDANRLIAAAVGMCRRDAELRENTALMDRYATQYPMRQRPRLVEQVADSENNLGGDQS